MADMPTWLIIVLAVIFLLPIVAPILVALFDLMFDVDGGHAKRKRNDDGKHVNGRARCGTGGDGGGGCGGGD
jgi:hypothetical protein